MNWIETHPGLAAWFQAVGTVIAIFAAIGIANWQLRHARKIAVEERIARRNNLLAAIESEVRIIMEDLALKQRTADDVLKKMTIAQEQGEAIVDGDWMIKSVWNMPDRTVYNALAIELGDLPNPLAPVITGFYGHLRHLEQVIESCQSNSETFERIASLAPTIREAGALLLSFLQNMREQNKRRTSPLTRKSEGEPMNDLLREAKERFLLEGQRTYIAINGGGAIALLAFLQAICDKPGAQSLLEGLLCGILTFAVGVVAGAATYPLRHYALNKGAFTPDHWLHRLVFCFMPALAIGAFPAGLMLPVLGALQVLP